MLRESLLDELKIKQKDGFAPGIDHTIFQSNHNPNRLYKVGPKYVVDEWLDTFRAYPQYFPRVYRTGEIVKHGKKYDFVEVEKLDTTRIRKEWEQLSMELKRSPVKRGWIDSIDTIFFRTLGQVDVDEKYTLIFSEFAQYLKTNNVEMFRLFSNWANFLKSVADIVLKTSRGMLDIHDGNFGYDAAGNMKCLDI